MKTWLRIVSIGLLTVSVATLANAADTKVQTMARILMNLNHFAGDADKKALQAIVDDKTTTAQEKTVAQAILGVQHKVTDADKPKLQAIVDDKKAPESLQTISSILLKLNHTASDEDKAKLKKLAGS